MSDHRNLTDFFKQDKSIFPFLNSLEQVNKALGPSLIFQRSATASLLDTIAKSPMYESYRTLNNLTNVFKNIIPKSNFKHKSILNFVDGASLIRDNSRYKEIFKSIDIIENTLGKQFNLLTQFNRLTIDDNVAMQLAKHRNLFLSFSNLSIKIANQRVKGEISEDEYKEIENITDSVSEIATLTTSNGYITFDDLQKAEKTILGELHKQGTTSLWLWILGLLLPFFFQWILLSNQNGNVSESILSEVRKLNVRVNQSLNPSIANYSVKRIVNRNCRVFLKPSSHSKLLAVVVSGKELAVINTSHKWALVLFLDNDGTPINGLILKKYLKK